MSSSEVSKLIANSPLNDPTQHKSRKDLFWMTSKPAPVSNPGITPLVSHWGGEVIYFWQDDSLLMSKLKSLGKTRIVEVRAPLSSSNIRHRAADSMVAQYAFKSGMQAYTKPFDARVENDLPASNILNIHTEGTESFNVIAEGIPSQ